jgi:hypothetical protein
VGTPRNPGDLDPDDPYAQTAPARPSFGDAAGGTAAYDGASLRAADEESLGQYDSTRGSPRVDPTGVMPGPRNVTHAVTPVGPVGTAATPAGAAGAPGRGHAPSVGHAPNGGPPRRRAAAADALPPPPQPLRHLRHLGRDRQLA